VGQPLNGIQEIGGPEQFGLDELVRKGLAAKGDPREVVTDEQAPYYGVRLSEWTLVPGADALLGEITSRLPEGPHYYPDGVVTDQPDTFLAAELLREKLLAMAREELPHSLAVTVEEVEERPDLLILRAVVRVERDSQKGIVIGKGGSVIKEAGTAARLELEALLGTKVHLETHVKVDKDWQRRPDALDRLGL
jgi:GTP-binding protein Era